MAEISDINVGWSNPCFEIWMYAYFGEMPAIRESYTCCDRFAEKFEKVTGQKYFKKDKDIYRKLVQYGDNESRNDSNGAFSLISTSSVRNEMVLDDTIECVRNGRAPVILTKYKEHAKYLYDNLKNHADYVFILYGGNTDKENTEIRRKMKEVSENQSLILVATGQKVGEGFDYPRLDTLMLAAPVSFAGRLRTYKRIGFRLAVDAAASKCNYRGLDAGKKRQ